MFKFPDGKEPLTSLTKEFRITANDCLTEMRASVAAISNILQEIAGLHANSIGIGIETLQKNQQTWMLGRLSLRLHRRPLWEETVSVTTWPCGTRGKLMALRHFVMTDSKGNILAEATSEWLLIDLATMHLMRIPQKIIELVHPDTYQLDIGQNEKFKEPENAKNVGQIHLPVRRHDIDANRHVNNVHYTEWALESLPENLFFNGEPRSFDIVYKLAAKLGDTICSTTEQVDNAADGVFYHRITRGNDNTVLAVAKSVFEVEK